MIDNVSNEYLLFEIVTNEFGKEKPNLIQTEGKYNRQMLIEKFDLNNPNIKSYEIYVRCIVACSHCGVISTFRLPLSGIEKYLNEGELVQYCFPEISRDVRELLISGICPTCFDNMFKFDEDE